MIINHSVNLQQQQLLRKDRSPAEEPRCGSTADEKAPALGAGVTQDLQAGKRS